MVTSCAASFGLPPLHDPDQVMEDQARLIDSIVIDGQVTTVVSPLKFDPDTESETLTYVIHGEPLQVLAEAGSWQMVVSVLDGYLGWLDHSAVSATVLEPTHTVSIPLAHVYEAPDLKSNPVRTLPMGAYVTATSSSQNGFTPLSDGNWVFAKHLSVVREFVDDPVQVAEKFLGVPYLWGGRTALGMDCSALVQIALAACGCRAHRDSCTQFESLGRLLVGEEKPMRGDLAFFPGHVGWMVDSTHILHANATNMAVTVDPVEDVIGWIAAETDERPFTGYRRL
ncbi:MAG: C40 family peptidase [Kordiimonadaceae bacterium]|nr:C40 family peptidase [Kordiimonadaceae bacterium]